MRHALGVSAKIRAVTGHFDPVHAAHVRRLGTLSQEGLPIVAIITDPVHPISPQRARAEVVAGLHAVAYVVTTDHEPLAAVLRQLEPADLVDESSADETRTRDLIAHVHGRQSCLGNG